MTTGQGLFLTSFLNSKNQVIVIATKVALLILGRVLPPTFREPSDPVAGIPTPLQTVPEAMYRLTTMARLPRSANRRAVYDAFNVSILELNGDRANLIRTLAAVCKASGLLKANCRDEQEFFEHLSPAQQVYIKDLPDMKFKRPAVLSKELHHNPSDQEVRTILETALRKYAHGVFLEFIDRLAGVLDLDMGGVMVWDESPDSATLHSFVQVDGAYRRVARDLVCCDRLSLEAAAKSSVPIPERIKELIDALPVFLRNWCTCTTGNQIGTYTVTPEHEKTPAEPPEIVRCYKFAAAISLSFLVLASWDQDELAASEGPAPTQVKLLK